MHPTSEKDIDGDVKETLTLYRSHYIIETEDEEDHTDIQTNIKPSHIDSRSRDYGNPKSK